MSARQFRGEPKKRFAVGAEVRVRLPGVNGIITKLDTSPTVLGEYWHTVRTEHGERREPGSNLELIPPPVMNAGPKEPPKEMPDHQLMPPDQATSLLKARLEIAVEDLRYDDPKVDAWERVSKKIVERAFGERSQNANHFAVTLSYARQSEDEKQAWHAHHIKEKKDLLRAFIEELEIIPPSYPRNPDYRFERMAVDEARKSSAEDDRPHPLVGCVVVKNGQVLATSHRGETGGNHAEYIALEIKLKDTTLAGCTVYTTLEPCTKRNNPKIACANRLIERRVARVFVGMHDPNPDICGKGIRKLQEANIEVTLFPHDLINELEDLNRQFTRSYTEDRTTRGEAEKEKERLVSEKRKLYNLLRKINCIECNFRFPPGPQDASFNGALISQINKDIESIRGGLVELLDLTAVKALVNLRIPAAPFAGASWPWLEATWREHFLPVQQLFRNLNEELISPAPPVGGNLDPSELVKPATASDATRSLRSRSSEGKSSSLQIRDFIPTEARDGSARFRTSDQPLGVFWNIMPFAQGADYEVFLASGPAMWLRLIPCESASKEWGHDELLKCGRGPGVTLQPLFWSNLQYLRAEDGVGAYATINNLNRETETSSVAFAFNTGEIWCVDTSVLQITGQRNLYFLDIARALIRKLRGYGEFLQCLGIQPPFNWIAGLEGVKGWRLNSPSPQNYITTSRGETCLSDVIVASGTYDLNQSAATSLRPFFSQIFKKCSSKIPEHIEEAIRADRKF